MKNKKRSFFASIVFMLLICVLPDLAFAQPDPGNDPDTGIPIDGGIVLLAAAGVAYGIKKKYNLATTKELKK